MEGGKGGGNTKRCKERKEVVGKLRKRVKKRTSNNQTGGRVLFVDTK
jgi:hypothetical protein